MGANNTSLLNKLQHKSGTVVILNAPPEFGPTLANWRADGVPVSERRGQGCTFVLVFVRTCAEIEQLAGSVVTSVGQDAVLWFAYPKKTSKRYRSDISRDGSWAVLGRMGFEPVRQVAIDDDWSALRFRPAEKITKFTRSEQETISDTGKARAASRR